MELLIIGYSNLFKSRILPLIDALDFVEKVTIAKFSEQPWDDTYLKIKKPVQLYDDFDSALNEFKGDLAYISTTNHSHYVWAKKALENGLNTIVDKPATLNLKETEELIEIAKSKNLLLSESTVYLYHPQMKLLKNFFEDNALIPKHITFLFSFPPLNSDNFRYIKALGGGALLDTGSYIASISRFIFNEVPQECYLLNNAMSETGVEISYSVLIKFKDGKSLIGHSGFTTEYVNRINILGKDLCVDIDRIFTLPDNVENTIKIRSKNQSNDRLAPAGNMFKEYLFFIDECIKSKSYQSLYTDMLMDAQTRNLLNISSEYGN
jgi:NDP-hexose-3-ketoreductase